DVDWVVENASILHYCWPHKPWKVPYAGRFGSLYKHYLQLAERSWGNMASTATEEAPKESLNRPTEGLHPQARLAAGLRCT
ncbi:MAG: hypothetical protein IKL97_07410, partial [Eggerthellaceae bacterium]|nr:hypothetical protein [Eggerthellaceae bacterium]